jgi:A/G-specific adenine glycosylase
MPWKNEKDPYKIWLSEIILQQTRVEQGWAYYEKFVQTFPTIFDLAKAKDEKVFKLWEGLGYYNRCRNLLYTAREIVEVYDGKFPTTYEQLLALKGIGPYTAAAIASFAFNLPYAVVDGNVFRVFSRFYGIHTPIDTQVGIQEFNKIAAHNLAKTKAGIYNQALMDFGATICKPMAPLCSTCVMKNNCVAYTQQEVGQLPIKLKQIQKKNRYLDFFCFQHQNKWMVQQRGEGNIWSGLYQFYLVEQTKITKLTTAMVKEILEDQLSISPTSYKCELPTQVYTQALTHQQLSVRFFKVKLSKIPFHFAKAHWISKPSMVKLPFPKIINQFFKQEGLD